MSDPQENHQPINEGELFRLLAENVKEYAVFFMDGDRRVLTWPAGAERLLGYRKDEILGQSADIIFTPEDRQTGRPARELEQALATGQGEDERWHVRRDGTRFWGSGQVIVLRQSDGQIRGFAKILRDRTDLKLAEDELAARTEASEKRRRLYEASLSNTPDLVYIFDLNHRFAYANEVLLEMWGLTWDEAIGKNCLELGYEPWHAAMHDREIDQVIATKLPIKGEVPFDGTFGRRVYEYIFVPVLNESGEVEAVAGTTRDVTERREAEERVQRSEQQLRGILESIADAFVAVDSQWRFEYVNGQAEKIYGRSRDELLGKSVWETFPELVGSPFEEPYRRAMAEGTPLRIEGPFPTLSDWFEIKAFPVVGGGLSFYFRDLSEQRRTEEALRDADRRKDEFLAMLAHELRNPLAPIRSGLDLLAFDGAESDVVGTMQQQVELLIRLVDDLLDVSRIMRGKIDLRLEVCELAPIIERAVETTRPQIESLRQNLRLRLPQQPVWLNADTVRLAQAISNLLHNASKYNHQGGDILLAVAVEADQLVLSVTDSGIGIEPELLPRVFDLFTQATRSIDRSQGGLGIGLTVVKSLIEMHGGTVAAKSAGPEQGSEFQVRLPTLQPAEGTPAPGLIRDSAHTYRILIVDDNIASAKMLSKLLAKLGRHEILLAHDGPDAIVAAQRHHPEIILLDLGLPKMNGFEVAKRLRRHPDSQSTLIVALTGYGTEEDRRRSREAGCDDHLVKPPGVDALRYVLNHPKLANS